MGTQFDRDVRAAVEFLADDPWRIFKALHSHVQGSHGWCALHSVRWPCTTYRLAEFADQLYRERLAAQIPAPRRATP